MPSLIAEAPRFVPSVLWIWPFAAMLLAIALLPLVRGVAHWWERNTSKLIVAAALSLATLGYYYFRNAGLELHVVAPPASKDAAASGGGGAHAGGPHVTAPGLETVVAVLRYAIVDEYIPFITLLFSLYTIAGGILVQGDIRATPFVNTAVMAIGAPLASLIGTTGASMVLIRLLLRTNAERRYRVHTVVFFIFIVSNCGGLLLPTGDPPLFLGYLMGVPFPWTLQLWPEWLFMVGSLLAIYFVWDSWAYSHEPPERIALDYQRQTPVRAAGLLNIVWLLLVVLAIAVLDPHKPVPGTDWKPWPHLREAVQLALVALSLATTPRGLRQANGFNYTAIGEVACLFLGIFITMQVPIELLRIKGPELELTHDWQYFWASGLLSSILDNAPTYVVYFTTAGAIHPPNLHYLAGVETSTGEIPVELLAALSCGAVFMGANTYIGNGPNFMVKSIAEQAGVRMPSFFGYVGYAVLVLFPLYVVLTLLFFHT